MVCGFGEQVSYETWSGRSQGRGGQKLSLHRLVAPAPVGRAAALRIGDVTHLRQVYEHLSAKLQKTGRASWLADEMAILNDPATYRTDPEAAWEKVKTRTQSPKFLGLLKELARFREEYAQGARLCRARACSRMMRWSSSPRPSR